MDNPSGSESPKPKDRIRLSPDVVAQRMGNDMVLVHLRTNRIFDLNATAARLWELMSEGHTVSNIQDQLLSEFEVDMPVLRSEIDRTLAAMKKEGFLVFDD
jgi:Coenzyme PQQ synthesis protein D (PqqD)